MKEKILKWFTFVRMTPVELVAAAMIAALIIVILAVPAY